MSEPQNTITIGAVLQSTGMGHAMIKRLEQDGYIAAPITWSPEHGRGYGLGRKVLYDAARIKQIVEARRLALKRRGVQYMRYAELVAELEAAGIHRDYAAPGAGPASTKVAGAFRRAGA